MLTNGLILPDNLSKRARLTAIICVLTFFGCQPLPPSAPSCRISENASPLPPLPEATAAACLIRIGNSVLMVRHRLSGKLDFPAGGLQGDESLRCAAHRETWEETGFNLEVGKLLTYSSSGMPVFHCKGEASMTALAEQVPAPGWAKIEVTGLIRVNPFELTDEALRFNDDLIPLRDAFVQAGEED
ncbi:MAG TPA: DNA mismatch repair protein MutT [Alteromonas sp.]|nr:DNA mismatch repair protein MutT [Alteromonas sp.]HCL13249.1 DNA mismatch repair protein MutT [Alteromonas sp.]HCV19720.1 DNA mismatch repair protein MutT [Alteromonas sp.]|tara:strand:- start:2738 stop:3295 length:558 start_codon:yes stop_codon:yes gene_type:complete